MSFSTYFSSETQRGHTNSNSLPVYANGSSAVQEKLALHPHLAPWWLRLSLPIPFLCTRPLRIFVLNPRRVHDYATRRFGRKRGCSILVFLIMLAFLFVFALARRFGTHAKQWPLVKDSRTLVYGREDLQRIWKWEIASGHYPSRRASAYIFLSLYVFEMEKLNVISSSGADTAERHASKSGITSKKDYYTFTLD